MKTLYVLGFAGYASPFYKLFNNIQVVKRTYVPTNETLLPQLLLFTGGEDIATSLYQEKSKYKYNEEPSQRDIWEKKWFEWAVKHKVPMFGTCRGMQMFTALTGGKLVQHVDGHHGHHPVKTLDGSVFSVNSIHHQMCVPREGSATLLAHAYGIIKDHQKPKLYPSFLSIGPAKDFVEPEALYFPEVTALGVQWHPESMEHTSEAHTWLMEQVQVHLPL